MCSLSNKANTRNCDLIHRIIYSFIPYSYPAQSSRRNYAHTSRSRSTITNTFLRAHRNSFTEEHASHKSNHPISSIILKVQSLTQTSVHKYSLLHSQFYSLSITILIRSHSAYFALSPKYTSFVHSHFELTTSSYKHHSKLSRTTFGNFSQ